MLKKQLNQFTGRLSPQQIAVGMNAAERNAARLAKDAQLLLEHKRFPSALSLALLSIEEGGKSSILRQLSTADSDQAAKRLWRDYRSHVRKNWLGAFPEFVAKGARKLGDFAELMSDKAEHPYLFEQLKQLGLYSDCLGNAHWSEPDAAIDESLAKQFVAIAALFARGDTTSSIEIELWVKHMRTIPNSDLKTMKEAVVAWYKDMQIHGLAPAGENEMEKFIGESLDGHVQNGTKH